MDFTVALLYSRSTSCLTSRLSFTVKRDRGWGKGRRGGGVEFDIKSQLHVFPTHTHDPVKVQHTCSMYTWVIRTETYVKLRECWTCKSVPRQNSFEFFKPLKDSSSLNRLSPSLKVDTHASSSERLLLITH